MTQTAHILLVKCMWALWLYYLESSFLRNSPKLLWYRPINCRFNDFFSTLCYEGVAFGHFDRFYQMNEIINWVNSKNCYKIDKSIEKIIFIPAFCFISKIHWLCLKMFCVFLYHLILIDQQARTWIQSFTQIPNDLGSMISEAHLNIIGICFEPFFLENH